MSFPLKKYMGSGRGDKIRTCGHLLPKRVLYQTELHPDIEPMLDLPMSRASYRVLFYTRNITFLTILNGESDRI